MAPDYVPPEEREKREVAKEFNEVLSGKFDQIPVGAGFDSSLEGVQKMTIVSPQSKDQAHVWLKYKNKNGRPATVTLTITKNGDLLGKLPEELSRLRKTEIMHEALEKLRSTGAVDFYVQTDMDFAPPGFFPTNPQEEGESKEETGKDRGLDEARMKFWNQKSGALFAAVTKKAGFKDYHLFFFKKFAALEHEKKQNAVYFIDLDPPLPEDASRESLSEEQKIEIVKRYWLEQLRLTKGEMIQKGYTRVVHQGDWESRVADEIAKRKGGQSEVRP